MSVQGEITRLETAKSDIAAAISAKGVAVPDGTKLDGLAALIESIKTGGGSGDSGIQAQHITSASDTITISGSGTVKVWGFGYYSASAYSKTRYSFVGDGYYLGSGYGAPTKTSASFSVSGGTLSGLPSDMTALDVLVTIGV